MKSTKVFEWLPRLRKVSNNLILTVVVSSALAACVFPIQPPTPAVGTPTTVASTTITATTATTVTAVSAPVTATNTVSTSVAPTATGTVTDLKQQYAAALQDAKVAEASEIYNGLTAITPANPKLTWQKETGQVLVTTWTSWNGYDSQVGNVITLTREVWVTAAPEFKTFCQSYQATPQTPLTLRLEELLGLPPNNGKTRVIELWATPTDMFRPSPDGEIDDTVAELTLPGADHFPSQQAYEFHRDWYNLQLKLDNYDDPSKGYPWTRLGYTYDWGNPKSEVGLSEFVISASSKVKIEKVYSTADYCSH